MAHFEYRIPYICNNKTNKHQTLVCQVYKYITEEKHREVQVMILRYFSKCRRFCHSTAATNGSNGSSNNHHHHHPRSLNNHTTFMERIVDKVSDVLELVVYWMGPLLIMLALSIVSLLCYTFVFILLPMMYQKHSVTTVQLLPESSYVIYIIFQQPQAFLVMTFHCMIVIVLITNVLYNYACCVLQSHVGVHYDNIIQELATITNTTLPTSPQELLSYRRRLSDRLTQRMKEQNQQRTTVRSTINESNHHLTNYNELTQRRTAMATSDDSLVTVASSTTFSDASISNLSSTTSTTIIQQQQQQVSATTTSGIPAPQQMPNGSATSLQSSIPPTPPIRAWMLLGPYEWGYCSQSHQPKPPRSHYDHVSKKLILNLDHYCPWMFNAGNVFFGIVGYFCVFR